jgi:hypothetical protein
VAIVLGYGVAVRAQVGEGVLSVDDGSRVKAIARLVKGRWVADAKCDAGALNLSPGQERLRATGDLRISPVRPLVPGSPEWRRLTPTIVGLFDKREQEQRLSSERTSDAPRAVDWIYAADDGDRRIFYFEISRRVASATPDVDDDTDPPGTVRIAVAGFLQDARDRLTPLGTKSELRWEQDGLPQGASRPDLTPLGLVTHGGRSVWVMKGQSGTSSWFTLYEIGADGPRIVLTARTARC